MLNIQIDSALFFYNSLSRNNSGFKNKFLCFCFCFCFHLLTYNIFVTLRLEINYCNMKITLGEFPPAMRRMSTNPNECERSCSLSAVGTKTTWKSCRWSLYREISFFRMNNFNSGSLQYWFSSISRIVEIKIFSTKNIIQFPRCF